MACIYLKQSYNALKIKQEINNLMAEYYPHSGQVEYWSGFSLRNKTGSTDKSGILLQEVLCKEDGMVPCQNNQYLEMMPYLKQVLDELPGEVHLVRVLKLKAGGWIPEHRDGRTFSRSRGQIARLHLPIQTNSKVEFHVGGKSYRLLEGELYYIDVSENHRAWNHNLTEDRIHLVIDLKLNSRIKNWLDEGDLADLYNDV